MNCAYGNCETQEEIIFIWKLNTFLWLIYCLSNIMFNSYRSFVKWNVSRPLMSSMMIKYEPYVVYVVNQGSGWDTATYIYPTRDSFVVFSRRSKTKCRQSSTSTGRELVKRMWGKKCCLWVLFSLWMLDAGFRLAHSCYHYSNRVTATYRALFLHGFYGLVLFCIS